MRSLRICKVYDGDYPWDVRVEKIGLALTAAGHDVHLVVRNRTGLQLRERFPEGTVHRLKRWRWAPERLSSASMFPAFFNPRWIAAILATARRERADLILCRDLPLAISAIWAGRRIGIPVILDAAESYPEMLRSRWEAGRMGISDWVTRNPAFAASVERWVLARIDHVLTVVEESRDRVISLGASPDKVSIVSNTPPRARVATKGSSTPPFAPLQIVYLGLMEEPRGVRTLLDAMALLKQRAFPARLTLLGNGKEYGDFLSHARSLNLGDCVEFRGNMPNSEALKQLSSVHVGVIPHFADESWHTTVPNKLFDYMAAGLAVVTSDARPVARIVRDTGAGLVFRDRDAGDLAAALMAFADASRVRDCAEHGRRAVRDQYNWERDTARLVAAIETTTDNHGRG